MHIKIHVLNKQKWIIRTHKYSGSMKLLKNDMKYLRSLIESAVDAIRPFCKQSLNINECKIDVTPG